MRTTRATTCRLRRSTRSTSSGAAADYLGRPLPRILRTNTTAVTLNQEIQFSGGEKFIVTVAGTTAASAPGVPAVGATVADGTATLRREK